MNKLRIGILSVALATLTASGCPLISGQFLVNVDLPTPLNVAVAGNVAAANIDLNTNSSYKDHKSNVKDISDFSLMAKLVNTTTPPAPIDLVLWMTPAITSYTSAAAVKGDVSAIQVWGPVHLNAGESRVLSWDDSAKLFSAAGKSALLSQAKGDGTFSLYLLSASSTATFQVQDGVASLLIDAGQ